jgi:hypothetical protein
MSDSFNDVYDRELVPELLKIDHLRKKAKRNLIISLGILASIALLPLAKRLTLTGALSTDQLKLIGIGMAIVAAIFGIMYSLKYKEYKIIFKKNVVKKMIETLFSGFKYNSSEFIKEGIYRDSQLFTRPHDRYKGEDYVCGKVGPTEIELSDIQTDYKTTTTDTKGGARTEWHTIFQGIFLHADLKKKMLQRTFVYPEYDGGFLGEVFAGALDKKSGVLETRGQQIKIENPIFEKHFVVFSSNLQDGRDLLAPKVQESLLILREKFVTLPFLAFIDGRIFIAVQNNVDHLEPRLWSPISKKEIFFFYELFQTLISIVKTCASV